MLIDAPVRQYASPLRWQVAYPEKRLLLHFAKKSSLRSVPRMSIVHDWQVSRGIVIIGGREVETQQQHKTSKSRMSKQFYAVVTEDQALNDAEKYVPFVSNTY